MPSRQPPQSRGSSSGRIPGGYGQRQRPPFGVGNSRQSSGGGGLLSGGMKMRLLIALGFIAFALISYYGKPGDVNQITGERERVALPEETQEMALGQQAAPEMVAQHGGASRSRDGQALVDKVGVELLAGLDVWMAEREQQIGVELHNPYQFKFTLLADDQTVNAFALPGGQVFITQALFARLETVGQLAGVLGHEVGHVVERHGNERMAKQAMFSTIAMGAGTAAGGDARSVQMAQAVANVIQMKYGRDDELQSDRWGVILTEKAGYDPRAMIGVMKVLDEASPDGGPPEMMSTHPKPANRVAYIKQVIHDVFPEGVRPGLTP
ncbi:TPR repeat-containing protein YfgC precursor [Botrimarina colliarenosi]|uniref:TPR repeat-containing protein YfgC n=2 Tax=Botrimarina colliarenosi TaxID=2528001 RepID=A0A5C6AIU0_9BACT|nr:TPR repeat-containing protein YfgC precursor [Botrimarina colliarenosi]